MRLRSGGVLTGRVRNARGNPDDPLSRAQVERKVRSNVDTMLRPEGVEEVVGALLPRPAAEGGDSECLSRVARAVVDLVH